MLRKIDDKEEWADARGKKEMNTGVKIKYAAHKIMNERHTCIRVLQ